MERNIIIKFLNRTANEEETRQVLDWLEKAEARKDLDEILKNEWDNPSLYTEDLTDYPKLLHLIHKRISISKEDNKPEPIFSWPKVFRMAASLVLLVSSIYFVKKGVEFENQIPVPVLSDKMIQRQTAIGEKLTLTLPDGTSIVLNANSTIIFSSSYGKKNRIVELEGEGYFQIAKDSLRPFELETQGIRTRALGTEFNAYSREGLCAIALTEGKVAIKSTRKTLQLKPGQMIVLDERDSLLNIRVENFDHEKVVGWKEGIINLDRVPLGSILNDLAKWYRVKIDIEDGFNVDRRVIGNFRNKNLRDVLTGLGFSMGFEFSINKNRVKIKKSSL